VNSFVVLCGKVKILNHKGFTKCTLSYAKEMRVMCMLLWQSPAAKVV